MSLCPFLFQLLAKLRLRHLVVQVAFRKQHLAQNIPSLRRKVLLFQDFSFGFVDTSLWD